ncbi:stage III sporulation protein AG [Clostridium algoriphilum]|uniref:stage III sporulation protein AG n=1 Tax=Clostridium algoriphilum TaxID=198347 RepID=UPI001CF22DB5|nr:stage III sporulation protein AG [Clostridium algoriphilum]MCB2291988.1 stage III sporulation protein AG [Clostridium algoriphilum]
MNSDNLLSKLTEYIKIKLNGGKEKNKTDKSKKSDKILGNLVLMILVAVVIVLASSFFKTPKATPTVATDTQKATVATKSTSTQTSDYETELENNLKTTLEGIDGVGKVQLMIYFASGEESVPAVNVNDSKSVTVENDTTGGKRNISQDNNGSTVVMTNNGTQNEPLIVKKYKPTITGVCVVAQGSGEKITELRIRQAVIDLFNLSEDKVNVYPMNK